MSDKATIINDYVFAFDKTTCWLFMYFFYQNDKTSLKTQSNSLM